MRYMSARSSQYEDCTSSHVLYLTVPYYQKSFSTASIIQSSYCTMTDVVCIFPFFVLTLMKFRLRGQVHMSEMVN
jgi:hypothetical protein